MKIIVLALNVYWKLIFLGLLLIRDVFSSYIFMYMKIDFSFTNPDCIFIF